MARYVFLMCAFVYLFSSCACEAKEVKGNTKAEDVAIKEGPSRNEKQIDTGSEEGDVLEETSETNTGVAMPPYESYDPNTGLPNVVESDTTGELE